MQLRRPTDPEGGFSIIEVVITTAILMVVVAAMLSLLVAAQRTTSFANRRGDSQDSVRLGLDRMTKELRQLTRFQTTFTADASGAWSGSLLDFYTYTPGNPNTPIRVRWYSSGGTLYREAFTTAGVSTGAVAVIGSLTTGASAPTLFSADSLPGTDPVSGLPVPWQITVSLSIDLTNPGSTYSTRSQVQLRNLQIPRPLT